MLNEKVQQYQIVGQHTEKVNRLLDIDLLTGDVCVYPGFRKHVKKKHKNCLEYIPKIQEIIANPDYVGVNPDEPNSVEYVKVFDKTVLLSVNLCTDKEEDYLYVSSLYDISEGKLNNRLNSERLKKIFDT